VKKNQPRILARTLAKTLSKDQLRAISGGSGTTSCSGGCADDCDVSIK
jgi:bacteriocin-like protein